MSKIVRVYTRRGGGFGASFGFFGVIALALGYLIEWTLIALLLVLALLPFLIAFLFGAIFYVLERVLWVVPAYRRRREHLGKVQWFLVPLNGMISVAGRSNGKRRKRGVDVATTGTPDPTGDSSAAAEGERTKKAVLAEFEAMSPIAFADAVGQLLYRMGYVEVRRLLDTPALIATDQKGVVSVFYCHSFSMGATVGVHELRAAIPLIEPNHADRLIVISLNPYTSQAKSLADDSAIGMWDRDRVAWQARQLGWKVRSETSNSG